ncbi:MAG: hypothetical protein KatS3mg131_2812 [Candidatus Tectimicrobiota bacterium]|nr:MAG: hypothetical protein KatS3mg131_2812 [Candidatus Tectomicrobia bacterium]
MWTESTSARKQIGDYRFRRLTIDLTQARVRQETVVCADLEDFLGGIGRAFKLLGAYRVSDPFAPEVPLIMNTGVFTGTDLMTGLRVFFSGYSPLKVAKNGRPLAMWSAASGKFGTKLAATGADEVIFTGRAARPVYLVIGSQGGTPTVAFEDATELLGKTTHEKILWLADRYPDAHMAVLGPAGEHWSQNYYAAIACSTVNELQSRDCKPRFAGRGGMGSLMGSKNLIAIVAQAPRSQARQAGPLAAGGQSGNQPRRRLAQLPRSRQGRRRRRHLAQRGRPCTPWGRCPRKTSGRRATTSRWPFTAARSNKIT